MDNQKLVTLITEEEIKAAIAKIGTDLGKTYENQQLVIVADLSSSFIFIADLIRELPIDVTIQFVTTPKENEDLLIDLGLKNTLTDKNVLIVNDVLNKGNRLQKLHSLVKKEKPANIQILNLIEKNIKERKMELESASLFKLEDVFVVGYGLTYKESYRGLKGIYSLSIEE
ncbi:phosphoribosyltransferase [Spiroplasma cantharicola]|uniref:Hypoxanthine-guanine phosphoribosyltransferase n=1 Tax=Spiroplasma cantharicola TaxID=362837 RepID=A0A0M4JJF0_9MOLU|nr:phosphoribosyltransferase family protein [Spiroplasma cantharicola]ALD66903.1 hypoxanthine-guanine phosphoribosyltransferase [Spiroplasma cantharicola]